MVWYPFRSDEIRTITSNKFKNQTYDIFKLLDWDCNYNFFCQLKFL